MSFLRFSKQRWSALGLILLAISISIGCAPAKEPTGLVTGSVMSAKKEVIGSCVVGLYNPVTLQNIGTRVDDAGTFEIEDIPFGDYQVMVGQMPSNDMEYVFDKRIPKKYRDKKTSGITVSVAGVEAKVLDIVIE